VGNCSTQPKSDPLPSLVGCCSICTLSQWLRFLVWFPAHIFLLLLVHLHRSRDLHNPADQGFFCPQASRSIFPTRFAPLGSVTVARSIFLHRDFILIQCAILSLVLSSSCHCPLCFVVCIPRLTSLKILASGTRACLELPDQKA
jgi:hypothetical protein